MSTATAASDRKMFLFEPVNKSHSIVEVVLFVHFDKAFPPNTIERMTSLRFDLEEEFPKYDELKKIEAQFSAGPDTQPGRFVQEIGGIELKSIKRDGNIEWMLRVRDNSISVHCLDYSEWNTIWERSHSYFSKSFNRIKDADVNITNIGLKYIDRFIFKSEEENYDASQLFKTESNLLFPRAFKSDMLWYCHSGWFENLSNNTNCLNQLNIDANYMHVAGHRSHVTTIDHNAIIRMGGANSHFRIRE